MSPTIRAFVNDIDWSEPGYIEKKVYQVGGGFDTDLIEATSFWARFQIWIEFDDNHQPSPMFMASFGQ